MMHNCFSALWGGYNAAELREEAAACEAWDRAQMSIYKRKCGLEEAEITRMMSETTYMTGQEAIDKGFADALLEDAQPLNIAASADGRSLFVRGREFHLCPGMFAPDSVPTASPGAEAPVDNTPPAAAGEGGNKMEDLAKAPAVQEAAQPAAALDQAAVERQRLRDIDAIAELYDPELVQAAKYGENPCTAQELAYKAAVQAAQKAENDGKAFLAAMAADTQAAAAVGPAPVPVVKEPGEDSPQAAAAQAKADVAAFQKMKEVRA